MLAHDGLREHFGFVGIPREVAVEANPSHVAVFADLVFADDWNVILCLASDNAGVATCAGVEIYRHAPLLLRGQFGMGVERNIWRDVTIHAHLLGEGVVFIVTVNRSLTNEIAAFHAAMLLGLSHRVVAVRDLESHSAEEKHGVGGAKRVGIETNTIHQRGNALASVTEGDRERVVSVTGCDHRRGFDGFFAIGNLHNVGDEVIVDIIAHLLGDITEDIEVVGFDAELLGRGWAHEHSVVPSQFGDKIRSLDKPGVVGIASIVHAGALQENEFQGIGFGRLGLLGKCGGRGGVEGNLSWRKSGVRKETIAEEGIPRLVTGAFGYFIEGRTNKGWAFWCGGAGEFIEQFNFGDAIPERKDHRLHRSVGAVESANIAPSLQEMGGGHMPAAGLRGFILEKTEVNRVRDFAEKSGEIEVCRSVLGWIDAEQEEVVDATLIDRGGKVFDGSGVAGVGFDWLEGGADVAEGAIDRVDERLERGRGERASEDDRAAGVRGEIGGAFFDPIRIDGGFRLGECFGNGCEVRVVGFSRNGEGQLAGEFTEFGRFAAQAVIRHAAGDREVVLHGVEAVHWGAFLIGTATGGEALGETDACLDRI